MQHRHEGQNKEREIYCLPRTELPRTGPCAAYEAKCGIVRGDTLQLGFGRTAFPAQKAQLYLLHILAFTLNSAATPALCSHLLQETHGINGM